MKGLHRYLVEVNLKEAEVIKLGLQEIFLAAREGDEYQNKPFVGKLAAVPVNSKLKVGEIVFMHHHAIDSLVNIDGVDYYHFDEPMWIVAHGQDMKAHRSLIVEPIEEKLTSSVIEIVQKDVPITKSKVLSSDVDEFKEGDIIEHDVNLNWEFFVKGVAYHYIRDDYTHRIFRVNGVLRDEWIEIKPLPQYVEVNGIYVPNKNRPTSSVESIEGEYAGMMIALESFRRVLIGKYVNVKHVVAILEYDQEPAES